MTMKSMLCSFIFAGININEPYLILLRGSGAAVLCMTSVVVFIVLIKQGYWNRRGVAKRLLILLWCLPSLSILYALAPLPGCFGGLESTTDDGACHADGGRSGSPGIAFQTCR